jgi:hypothetical protein
MAWCRHEDGFPRHPKVLRLARLLSLSRREAVGLVCDLWDFALSSRPSGDLSGLDHEDLAQSIDWPRPGAELIDALVSAGLVDRDGDRIEIHGWLERAESYVRAQKEKSRRDAERGARVGHADARVGHADARVGHRARERRGEERSEQSGAESERARASLGPGAPYGANELLGAWDTIAAGADPDGRIPKAPLTLPSALSQRVIEAQRSLDEWRATFERVGRSTWARSQGLAFVALFRPHKATGLMLWQWIDQGQIDDRTDVPRAAKEAPRPPTPTVWSQMSEWERAEVRRRKAEDAAEKEKDKAEVEAIKARLRAERLAAASGATPGEKIDCSPSQGPQALSAGGAS